MCKIKDEDLEHLFLRCKELGGFHRNLKKLLEERCHMVMGSQIGWEWCLLFGVKRNMQNVNANVVNILLAMARRSIFMRRNYVLYEGKRFDVWGFYVNQVKAFFKLHYYRGFSFFENAFMGGNTLFSGEEKGPLVFYF